MPMHHVASHVALIGLILYSGPALAYAGPGAGLSAIGSVLAFLGVMVLIIVGFLWYPAKRLLSRVRRTPASEADKVRDET